MDARIPTSPGLSFDTSEGLFAEGPYVEHLPTVGDGAGVGDGGGKNAELHVLES